MTQEEFNLITNKLFGDCNNVLTQGSKEYAGDEDKLANFKDCAELIGISPEKVAFVYLYKHIAGVAKYVRNQEPQRDSIEGRVTDAINYLALLNAILLERPSIEGFGDRSSNKNDSLSREQDNEFRLKTTLQNPTYPASQGYKGPNNQASNP